MAGAGAVADFPESGEREFRPRLAVGEDGDGFSFSFALFDQVGDEAFAGVLALPRGVVHEREQIDGAFSDQGLDEIADLDAVAAVFVTQVDAGAGESVGAGHCAHAGDDIAAGEAGSGAALGVGVAHVQRVIDCRNPAGDELAVEFVDRDLEGKVGAGPRGDFLLQRIGVKVDQPREQVGTAGVERFDAVGGVLGEFGGRSDGGDDTAFGEQGVVGEDAGRSDEGGVGDKPAAHSGIVAQSRRCFLRMD